MSEPKDWRSIQIEYNWDEWARLTIVNQKPRQRVTVWPRYTREERELQRQADAILRADKEWRTAYWASVRWGLVETDLQRDARLCDI